MKYVFIIIFLSTMLANEVFVQALSAGDEIEMIDSMVGGQAEKEPQDNSEEDENHQYFERIADSNASNTDIYYNEVSKLDQLAHSHKQEITSPPPENKL